MWFSANTGEKMSLKKEMGEVLLAQGKEMREIKSNLAALSAQMAVMMEEVKKRGKGSLFNMGGDTSLSTSSLSTDPLRPCILAIRDGLRPRELPRIGQRGRCESGV
jgi:hypothetical protein